MSEKIEQLLELQNEILERMNSNIEKQQHDIEELVKLTYLVIQTQTFSSKLSKSAKSEVQTKLKENFS